ncbi:MAG: Vitamin B12 dependent methionine synthase activation subunit [Lachnospiraceae bacterium]|nr:Vitamin B12 dependent methionine synthase activation subunit [Lachnospiraceae bacterium]
MDSTVQIWIAESEKLDISMREVRRYLGYSRMAIQEPTEEDDTQISEVIESVRPIIAGKACYCRYPLKLTETDIVELPYGSVHSSNLYERLRGCSELWIFAATIGVAFDRMLARESLRSMAKAALLQSVGAAAIEAVCDALNAELAEIAESEGKSLCPRYSPGYGNYLLENQKGVFALLNPSKHIGLSLTDSLLMKPEKSVTALIGIRDKT